ncbi:hypothetical protein IVB43_30450 [Bradyrhizobium sp. 48]|nr:hypothetical protein [Bradyrhizobium sp. 48]
MKICELFRTTEAACIAAMTPRQKLRRSGAAGMCLPCETIEIRNPNQQNLTGRQKDRIIRRGHSIDPGTVEDACFSHPGISLCAPVGQIDVNEGEIPVAFVVMKPGYNPRHSKTKSTRSPHFRSSCSL